MLPPALVPDAHAAKSLIQFRLWQQPEFLDRSSGIAIWHWSRQIGKSYALASWALDRMLTKPGRLVTYLSHSKDGGKEFVNTFAAIALLLRCACAVEDLSLDERFENMNYEAKFTHENGMVSRLKVLAANPRTARGVSGDLILDEFAFHENSEKIWDAAEPIISANPDFLCRIASTGNGRNNMFYRMKMSGTYKVSTVTIEDACRMGHTVYHPVTRKPCTWQELRAMALDKQSWDQNYMCSFNDENMCLLTHELISAAESAECLAPCEQEWRPEILTLLREAKNPLYAGVDVARSHDFTCISVGEKFGPLMIERGLLRIRNMRLPDQQRRLDEILRLPLFTRMCIDMTGLGLGLCEYAQETHGNYAVEGVNFGTSSDGIRITERMATRLLQAHEDRAIKYSCDAQSRDDMRKVERVLTAAGNVRFAAARTSSGHADHFWSRGLLLEAAEDYGDVNFITG